ncbi:MAG: NAD(P)-dependent alcohol dehydrogenase [Bacteroidota bacterium]
MKAFTRSTYGGPDVLQLTEVEMPPLKDDHLLVKVKANAPNPADWHMLRGKPALSRLMFGLFKPKNQLLGADFAGVVEAVGSQVSHFQVGDQVFGENLAGGAFAAYTSVAAEACGRMPDGVGFPEMASTPIAAVTALQALITHGKLQPGEAVLINGASGGVGHFAVQIAKAYGAVVTGVCSERNRTFVKGLGADHVIAYDQESIHAHPGKYALVFDTHGNLFLDDFLRMGQRGVLIGFTTTKHLLRLSLRLLFNKFPLKQFTARANTQDLETIADLIHQGKVRPHLEKTYSYQQIPEAIGYIEAMRTRGKVVMVWEE